MKTSKKDFEKLFAGPNEDFAAASVSSRAGRNDGAYAGLRSLLVASMASSAKAISNLHDQTAGSLLSSVGSSYLSSISTSKTGSSRETTSLKAPNDEAAKTAPKISKTRSRFFLGLFLCLFFIGAALFSVPAPFFPNRAIEKGVSQTMAGIILGSMQLVQFLAAATFAVTMFHFGLKFMLCYGIFWAASCSILFGVLDLGPDDASYTVLCFLVRLVQGIGVSAYYISSSTIAAVLFSDNYGFTIGMLQTFYSLGCLIGPSLGGALYAAGGYITPFVTMGVLLMIFAPIIAIAIPSDVVSTEAASSSHENPLRVFKIMLCPALGALFYTMLVGTMTTVFTETTMGVRLTEFGVTDPLLVGCVYLSSSGAYGFTAPFVGHIADKYDAGWAVMFIGTILSIVGYLVIGPSPIFAGLFEKGLVQLIIGSFIAHSGIASVLIPMTRELQRVAHSRGLDKESPPTLSFISAFFDSCWGMGGFLGAFIAGALMENLGFEMATTIQAVILLPSLLFQGFLFRKFGHLNNFFARHQGYAEI